MRTERLYVCQTTKGVSMTGLRTRQELQAEVARLTKLNARYRREANTLRGILQIAPVWPVPWYRRLWNCLTRKQHLSE